ncbi:carotenoid ester lipase [Moniliophthora roreri MCA 2997]|uniref:Carboxylic ester hydrolase n=1 Tax=Moniliophthora roreri (strain MCA 2997) TaxID=1381753 RepID=V2YW49_MONRO|nr:carotenoid ester lipase [Moniliophthora roreri MCA 2997]
MKKLLPDMLFRLILHVVPLVSVALSKSSPLDVRLGTGVFRGVSTTSGTEKWLGIPFAAAPVGSRRFKAPVPLTHGPMAGDEPVKDASEFGNACPQPPSSGLGAPISEDCLFLNVWRPQNTSADAKLPILVWFHGGAYTTGAGSAPSADPTRILLRSVEIEKPIIFVSVNYRLNTFGFLASSSVPKEDLNAGLLDQAQALRFLQQNIGAFGGDPEKVTIWGQSAGAGSVESLFLFPGKDEKLFRAGISDSSTGPFKSSPPPETYDKPGKPFTRVLQATGCSAGPEAVNCLRDVPFETLLNVSNAMIGATLNSQLWQPTISPGTKFHAQASEIIKSGDFVHLPYLAGTNVNEGAGFSVSLRKRNLTGPAQDAAFDDFIARLLIDNSTVTEDVLQETHRLWAQNDTTLGAPFNTGDSLFDRAEAWYTDEMYLAPRRLLFEHAAEKQDLFAYYFREFIPGNDPTLGVAHASELQLFFGPVPDVEVDFANTMTDFYINFINDLNPGPEWPKYDLETRPVLQLLRGNVTVIPDDWDVDKTDFLNSEKVLEEFQK